MRSVYAGCAFLSRVMETIKSYGVGKQMIRIAICEDSKTDQKILHNLLKHVTRERKVESFITTFACGEELLTNYRSDQFDLVFMDIFMNGLNGMDVGREIRKKDVDVEIVFCTSSTDFALESYEIFPLGYLLKPYDIDRISNIMDFYLQKRPYVPRKCLVLSIRDRDYRLNYKDIIYVESVDKVVIFHTVNDGDVRLYEKLGNIQDHINDGRFLRCNQSYLINMDYIIKRDNFDFVMTDGSLIPIRKRQRKQLVDIYKNYINNH